MGLKKADKNNKKAVLKMLFLIFANKKPHPQNPSEHTQNNQSTIKIFFFPLFLSFFLPFSPCKSSTGADIFLRIGEKKKKSTVGMITPAKYSFILP